VVNEVIEEFIFNHHYDYHNEYHNLQYYIRGRRNKMGLAAEAEDFAKAAIIIVVGIIVIVSILRSFKIL
jgi:hypothetical protein